QRGKAQRDVFAGFMQFFRRGDAVHGGGIDLGPAAVIGNLETAPLVSRDSVEGDAVALFHPDGQLLVAETPISGGRAEEKNFLTCCTDELRQLGKNLSQPRTASKNKFVRPERRTVAQFDPRQLAAGDRKSTRLNSS